MLICKKRKIEDKRYKILKVIILYNKLQDIFNTYNKLIIVKAKKIYLTSMTSPLRDQPWGLQVIENTLKCCAHSRVNRVTWHQGIILVLTYLAYTCYHMTRKPMSVVKNVLSFNCSTLPPPPNFLINTSNQDTWCDWAPFGKYNISITSQFKVI